MRRVPCQMHLISRSWNNYIVLLYFRQSARNVMTPVDFDVRSNASRVSKASKSSRGTSYKDMGGSKRNAHNGSSSYKNMSNPPNSGVKDES